jgi:nitroreductase/NAD-dependent dihydropyrimidine dehydrogenase PreA subunit
MRQKPITTIDEQLCTGCESCVRICPSDTLSIRDGIAAVTGEESMHCAQCAAVCPVNAISLEGIGVPRPETIEPKTRAALLSEIMMSRRSCRAYKDTPLERAVIEDLVTLGSWAPSGTNSQMWTFTIIPDRKSMLALAEKTADFYRRLNKMARNPINRGFSRLFMKDVLGDYYREYHDSVELALDEWARTGRERLFHGAVAGILVATRQGVSCPVEDALMASQNIVLAAEAMGLGTCLVGFVVNAMARDRSIGAMLGIPANETVHAVIAMGHPDVKYVRPSGRKKVTPRYFTADSLEKVSGA